MTLTEWGTFGGFVALLIGLSLVNPRLATVAGVGVIGVIFVKYLDTKGANTPSQPSGVII